MTQLEISKKPCGEVIEDLLERKGFSHKTTINQNSRIVVFTDNLTTSQKNSIRKGLPAWFRAFYKIKFIETE